MNEFSSTENTGLLKTDYGQGSLMDALKKRRENLYKTKSLVDEPTDEEIEEDAV